MSYLKNASLRKMGHLENKAFRKMGNCEIARFRNSFFLVYLKNFEVTDFPNRPFL